MPITHEEHKQLLYAEGILRTLRLRSVNRNMAFDLDANWITDALSRGCAKTGVKFDLIGSRRPFQPSIDRIDSNKGYTKDNCQAVLLIYNYSKNSFRDDDVYAMALALIANGTRQEYETHKKGKGTFKKVYRKNNARRVGSIATRANRSGRSSIVRLRRRYQEGLSRLPKVDLATSWIARTYARAVGHCKVLAARATP